MEDDEKIYDVGIVPSSNNFDSIITILTYSNI